MGKLNDRLNALEEELNYFRNASNRHEAVISEMREEIVKNDHKRCHMNFELARVRVRIDHLEDYHCDCPIDKEENEEEELKLTIEAFRKQNQDLYAEIIRLKGKLQAADAYIADCRENEEEEEEEECEEEICPDCRENQIKEVFEQEQQKLKIYVKTLGIALKELSKHLEDLERA